MSTSQSTVERSQTAEVAPRGTFTFVFTDVEGSTRLWERFPDEMGQTVARHDTLLFQEFEAGGGHVFKTVGDRVCCAFTQADAALRSALAALRAVASESWSIPERVRVRIAIHTGPAEMRSGDYFGNTLGLTARLLSAGHGEQVLLSGATYGLIAEDPPTEAVFVELGTHYLKDIPRPQQIYQCLYPDGPNVFPPLKTQDYSPTNLPAPLNSFVGREGDLTGVMEALTNARVVTLVGAGGGGKTRLALEVARNLVPQFPDGVWVVDLSALTDPAQIPQAISSVLSIREETGRSPRQALAEHLRHRHLLLVLDNCEQIAAGCAAVSRALLQACPDVRLLATSRAALGVSGEIVWRVAALSPPPGPKQPLSVEAVQRSEAVRLFAARAGAVQPGFEVTEQNMVAVATICRRLEGIPLALELAAARVKMMSVAQIAARVEDQLRLLTGSRSALPRHQTLRAAIEWSHSLLTEPERRLLRRTSVFPGGWTLEAAEAVCADGHLAAEEVLDLLGGLVDQSMVTFDEAYGAPRYQMLEMIRQYGSEQLQNAGETEGLKRRHADWYRQAAETAAPELLDARQAEGLNRLDDDYGNFRAALEWSLQDDGARTGLALISALYRYWTVRGSSTEGLDWVRRILAVATEEPTSERARALNAAGGLALCQGDTLAARSYFEESLAICRLRGDIPRTADLLNNMGMLALDTGELNRAYTLLEESLVLQRGAGDAAGVASTLSNLALVARTRGDLGAAQRLLEECLVLDRGSGDLSGIANSTRELADLARQGGDFAGAHARLLESLTLRRDLGDRPGIAECLESFGSLYTALGQTLLGILCWASADVLRSSLAVPLAPAEQSAYDEDLAKAKVLVGEDVFLNAWREGALRPSGEVIDELLHLRFHLRFDEENGALDIGAAG